MLRVGSLWGQIVFMTRTRRWLNRSYMAFYMADADAGDLLGV